MNQTHTYSTALVTGATSGIGRAITLELAANGCAVTALGRNTAALGDFASVSGVQPLALDLLDRQKLADLGNQKFDILVNNAGMIPPVVPFDQMNQTDIDMALDVNLNAVLAVSRIVLPGMAKRKCGHIFFVGSIAGHAPFANMAVYGATKAAISSFAAALRIDLSGSGVRVTEIVPGRVETALYKGVLNKKAQAALYRKFETIQPNDVATMLSMVLAMPAHVDVTRFDILPTAQFVGGGGYAAKSDLE